MNAETNSDTLANAQPRKGGLIKRGFVGLTSLVWFVVIIGLFAGVAFAVGGFVRFTYTASQAALVAPGANAKADAIVVLTGGEDRIKQAVGAMQNDRGARLLITGVNEAADLQAIAEANNLDAEIVECCIDIDRTALDTIGNAEAAARWAERNGYASLIVVTSNLHMRRSMLEFNRQMPDVSLLALPVETYNLRSNDWIGQPETWRALFTEYGKYVAARLRGVIGEQFIQRAARTVNFSTA